MDFDIKKPNKSLVWDTGSSLYDSFELASFERQLDSAIVSSRSLSMPRLSDSSRTQHTTKTPKKSSKFSRSFHKLLRTIFGPRQASTNINTPSWLKGQKGHFAHEKGFHFFYDGSGALTTIPEEIGVVSPEMGPMAGKAASERFTTCVGITCA